MATDRCPHGQLPGCQSVSPAPQRYTKDAEEPGIPFVAQVKNGREWLYPPEDTIWDLFGAAAQLRAVPILIARRLPAGLSP
jgi:hypothetical protein